MNAASMLAMIVGLLALSGCGQARTRAPRADSGAAERLRATLVSASPSTASAGAEAVVTGTGWGTAWRGAPTTGAATTGTACE